MCKPRSILKISGEIETVVQVVLVKCFEIHNKISYHLQEISLHLWIDSDAKTCSLRILP